MRPSLSRTAVRALFAVLAAAVGSAVPLHATPAEARPHVVLEVGPQPAGGRPVVVRAWLRDAAPLSGYQITVDGGAISAVSAAGSTLLAHDANAHDLSIGDLDDHAVLAAVSPTAVDGDIFLGEVLVPSARAAERLEVHDTVIAGPGRNAGAMSAAERDALAAAWEERQLADGPCEDIASSDDLTGDGCLDIADLVVAAESPSSSDAPAARSSSVLVVTTTSDQPDTNIGNGTCATASGGCSLRAAMQEANATTGPATINFAISGPSPHRINVGAQLPRMVGGDLTIDGYSQAGSRPNTDPDISNAAIGIEVHGNDSYSYDGFTIVSADNVLKGLAVFGFRRPIWIYGSSALRNRVTGSFIGTDSTGTYAVPTLQAAAHGIHIEQNAAKTQVGGPTPADRNVISGNGRQGIGLWHNRTDDSVIQGNIVGLSPDGSRALGNRKHGVDLNFGVSGTLVEDNVISGNDESGIEISHTTLTTDNQVIGNVIGGLPGGATATAWSGNGTVGVAFEDGASQNVMEHNVIVNNAKGGITFLDGPNGVSSGNIVRSNDIGVTATGEAAGNGLVGVSVNTTDTVVGPANTIANNLGPGVRLNNDSAVRNTITQNSIFGNDGLGIDLAPTGAVNLNDPGDTDGGPNTRLNFPVIGLAQSGLVSGTACGRCTVELFRSDDTKSHGSGAAYLGSTVAGDDGRWVVLGIPLAPATVLTATATDASGNTSEFARNVATT